MNLSLLYLYNTLKVFDSETLFLALICQYPKCMNYSDSKP